MRPSLMPGDTPDHMVHAWASCISWAIRQPNIIEEFRCLTGNHWHPAQNPLEAAIDAETGAEEQFIKSFVEWANVTIWGPLKEGLLP